MDTIDEAAAIQNGLENNGNKDSDESCILIDNNITTIDLLDESVESRNNITTVDLMDESVEESRDDVASADIITETRSRIVTSIGDFKILDEVGDEEVNDACIHKRSEVLDVNGTLVS